MSITIGQLIPPCEVAGNVATHFFSISGSRKKIGVVLLSQGHDTRLHR